MSKSQRRKGQEGEREVARLLSDALGDQDVARQLGQERDGGADIYVGRGGGDGWALQVKRAEQVRIHDWMLQAEADCPPECRPAVVARRNRGQWLVTIALDDFAILLRDTIG